MLIRALDPRTEDPHGSISAGAPALLLLRSRLGSLVERLEARMVLRCAVVIAVRGTGN